MTKKERIEELERRLAKLELRLNYLEAVQAQPLAKTPPYPPHPWVSYGTSQ